MNNNTFSVLETNTMEAKLSTGEVWVIKPLKIGQLASFLKEAIPLANTLALIAPYADSHGASGLSMALKEFVPNLGEELQGLINCVRIGSQIPEDKFNALEMEDFIDLAAAVIKLNADIIQKKIAPKVQKHTGIPLKELTMKTIGPVESRP